MLSQTTHTKEVLVSTGNRISAGTVDPMVVAVCVGGARFADSASFSSAEERLW